MPQRIQVRKGTATAWTTANPVLASGEIGFETDTNKFKFGDGTTAWTSLPYVGAAADLASHLADTTDAHDASAISFAATGNILATDVQGALAELDTKKAPATHLGIVGSAASVYRSTSQSIPNATLTAISFDTPIFEDDPNYWDAATPSRITIPTGRGGLYLIYAKLSYDQNVTTGTSRAAELAINGTTKANQGMPAATWGVPITLVTRLVAGDYVQLMAWHNAGSALGLTIAGYPLTTLSLARLGD